MLNHNSIVGILQVLQKELEKGLNELSELFDDDTKKEIQEAQKTGNYNKLKLILEDVRNKYNR